MEAFTKGSVVLIPFPFSDLSNAKVRPAIIVAVSDMADFILCQITSNSYSDQKAIKLADSDFTEGSLQRLSFVKPSKLFTANQSLIIKQVGSLSLKKMSKITDAIVHLLKA
jgi:mRNA interferase MazF